VSCVSLLGWIVFGGVTLTLLGFALTFFFEGERRATAVTAVICVLLSVLSATALLAEYPGKPAAILAAVALLVLGLIMVVGFQTKSEAVQIAEDQKRVDERDAVFHRFYRLEPGTPEFESYYNEHPNKKEFDEKVRQLPLLSEPVSKTYHPLTSPFQVAAFGIIEEISRNLEWKPIPLEGKPIQTDFGELTKRIKGFACYLGAKAVGCTKLNPAYVYSHIGRSPGKWGSHIEMNHSHAIALAVEMSSEMLRHAPDSPTTTETAFKYLEVGKIAMVLARYLNLLGYEARAHVDANYRVMCVPIAADAGLGELGRLGLLITPKWGSRVRLAVVTTDLPLAQDKAVSFGVQDFCSFCKKCADICPSGSVDKGEKRVYQGVEKWQTRRDTCYRYWRVAGSDCALCVKVCPYSHPLNPMHNLVRWAIKRNHLARRLALWGDDLAYGRKPKTVFPYPEWHENK
jgi:reductive dehalogenase